MFTINWEHLTKGTQKIEFTLLTDAILFANRLQDVSNGSVFDIETNF